MQSKVDQNAPDGDSSFLIQDGQTVVFIGDSITDCGRRDECAPLGNGYVKMTVDLITARYPQRRIKFFNKGIGGDVSPGLRDRWTDDVLPYEPDWVSVLVGINDLHRRFNPDPQLHIPPEKYRQAYSEFLQQTTQATKAKLVLMDPFYISKDNNPNSQRTLVLEILAGYINIVREMAEKFDALHVPTHDIFQQQLECRSADTFCPEPIHPNPTGHQIMAHAWLKAVGW